MTNPYSVAGYFLSLSDNLVITSPYGWRTHPVTGEEDFHAAVDIAGEPEGFPTPAPSRSQVDQAIQGHPSYGNYVVIQQLGADYQILIAHMANITVNMDQLIDEGYNLGGMGKTGMVTGTHWHIEVRQAGEKLDPEQVTLYTPSGPPPSLNYQLFSRRIIHRRTVHRGRR